MDRSFIIRALSLYLPLFGGLILWNWRKPARAEATGALLATAWNLPALLALNVLAARLAWWHFNARGAVFLNMPVDLWLGWSVLWGAAAALLFRYTPLWLACWCLAVCDLLLMPLCLPVVVLGRFWFFGELVGLASCLLPALCFARWTRKRVYVKWRAALQFVTFGGIFLVAILIAHGVSGGHRSFSLHSTSAQIIAQVLFILALPGLSAVQEFAEAGNGTPLPYDPPTRLVTTGIYAYIANPMQAATTLLLLVLGYALHSVWLLLAALVSVIYCVGIAAWDEDGDLRLRHGAAFLEYRANVRDWIPRWHPSIASPARIYLSVDCFKCSQMASFLRALNPLNLEIIPAEEHPSRDLERMTYEWGNGAVDAQGIEALARALEHVNLAWAFAGMALRLPLISKLLQAIADISGGGPSRVTRRGCDTLISQGSRKL